MCAPTPKYGNYLKKIKFGVFFKNFAPEKGGLFY